MSDFGHRLLLVELLALVLRDACRGFSLKGNRLLSSRCAIDLRFSFFSDFGIFCFCLSGAWRFGFCLGGCLLCVLGGLWSGIDSAIRSRSA